VCTKESSRNKLNELFDIDLAKRSPSLFDEANPFAFKGNVLDFSVGIINCTTFGNLLIHWPSKSALSIKLSGLTPWGHFLILQWGMNSPESDKNCCFDI